MTGDAAAAIRSLLLLSGCQALVGNAVVYVRTALLCVPAAQNGACEHRKWVHGGSIF